MLGADQLTPDSRAASGHDVDFASGFLSGLGGLARVVRKSSLRAAQVGNAHGRELNAAQFLGWERDGNPNDAAKDPILVQHVPERLALAKQPHVGSPERNGVLAEADGAPRRPYLYRT